MDARRAGPRMPRQFLRSEDRSWPEPHRNASTKLSARLARGTSDSSKHADAFEILDKRSSSAFDDEISMDFPAKQITRVAFGWIVAWTSGKHGHAMLRRKGIRHERGAFGSGAGVRRKI